MKHHKKLYTVSITSQIWVREKYYASKQQSVQVYSSCPKRWSSHNSHDVAYSALQPCSGLRMALRLQSRRTNSHYLGLVFRKAVCRIFSGPDTVTMMAVGLCLEVNIYNLLYITQRKVLNKFWCLTRRKLSFYVSCSCLLLAVSVKRKAKATLFLCLI
jgi:hypothetical protein